MTFEWHQKIILCVCERERETERDRELARDRETGRDRERDRERERYVMLIFVVYS